MNKILLSLLTFTLLLWGAVIISANKPASYEQIQMDIPVTEPNPSIASQVQLIGATKMLIVNLGEQNSSGQAGTAFLENIDDTKTKVIINLTDSANSTPQPAHIHFGSCAAMGEINHNLNPVVNGLSETTLDVPLNQILNELPGLINVHKSEAEMQTSVSCGDVMWR